MNVSKIGFLLGLSSSLFFTNLSFAQTDSIKQINELKIVVSHACDSYSGDKDSEARCRRDGNQMAEVLANPDLRQFDRNKVGLILNICSIVPPLHFWDDQKIWLSTEAIKAVYGQRCYSNARSYFGSPMIEKILAHFQPDSGFNEFFLYPDRYLSFEQSLDYYRTTGSLNF